MSNLKEIKVKEVGLILDKERHLRYDLNAMSEVEEKFGDIQAALTLVEKMNIKAIKNLLWAGLIHEETKEDGTYNITENQIGKLVGIGNIEDISRLIIEAFGQALPEEKNAAPNLMEMERKLQKKK